MKLTNHLISVAVVLTAMSVASRSEAASNCLSLELSAPSPMCAGQLAAVGVSVTNSCPTPLVVSAQFSVDDQSLPVRAQFTIAGDSTRTKSMSIPVPASASAATHTLTVSLTDRAGDDVSQTIDLSVASCAAPGSGSGMPIGRRPSRF